MTTLGAWREALNKASQRGDILNRHPHAALEEVLVPYARIGCSASQIESNFSVVNKIMGRQRIGAREAVEEDVVRIVLAPGSQREICRRATAIWASQLEKPRTHRKHRMDKGVKRKTLDPPDEKQPKTERALLRQRRAEVGEAISQRERALACPRAEDVLRPEHCGEAWADTHVDEREFQETKLKKRQMEAAQTGTLLHHELSDEIMRETLQFTQDAVNRKRARESLENRAAKLLASKQFPDLRGRVVVPDQLRSLHVLQRLTHLGLDLAAEDELSNIQVFVNDRFDDLSKEQKIAAALQGSWFLEKSTLMNFNRTGVAIKFNRALASRRWVFMTKRFSEGSARIAQVIRTFSAPQMSSWRLITSAEDFAVRKHRAIERRKSTEVIALISPEEANVFSEVSNVYTIDQLAEFVTSVDRNVSSVGCAGC